MKWIANITEEGLNNAMSRLKADKSPVFFLLNSTRPLGLSWYQFFFRHLMHLWKMVKSHQPGEKLLSLLSPEREKTDWTVGQMDQFRFLTKITSIPARRVEKRPFPRLSILTREGLAHRDKPMIISDFHFIYWAISKNVNCKLRLLRRSSILWVGSFCVRY